MVNKDAARKQTNGQEQQEARKAHGKGEKNIKHQNKFLH